MSNSPRLTTRSGLKFGASPVVVPPVAAPRPSGGGGSAPRPPVARPSPFRSGAGPAPRDRPVGGFARRPAKQETVRIQVEEHISRGETSQSQSGQKIARKAPKAAHLPPRTELASRRENQPKTSVKDFLRESGSEEGQGKDARRFGTGAAKRKSGNIGASEDIDVTSAPSPAPETIPVPPYNFGVEEEEGELEVHAPPPKRPAPAKTAQKSAAVVPKSGLIRSGQVAPDVGGRITVEAPAPPKEPPFVETPLPGVADEVESYPCKFCPERVFLTSFGLERHTKMAHPDKLDEILEDIVRIQEEWKRREKEREKQRERLALAKIRQEALAAAAAREALQTVAAASHGNHVLPQQENQKAPAPPKVQGTLFGQGDVPGMGQSNFESCRICGLLINADHPTAMENHMRAHKKNDELRQHLLNTFGPEFVARVTCHECQLVFTDERKLIAHAEAMHVRRRKYVCKWCGHVCLTMTDLNNHKADVHGMPVSRSRDPDVQRSRQLAALTKGHGMPPPLGVQSAATRRAVAVAEAVRAQQGQSPRVLTSVEELPCRTTCDFCGLVMVKPSLLIRHMMRVHNRTNFTATVETKGMPSFKVTVDQGKLSWTCCQEVYTDRSAFVYHRRMNHTPKLAPSGGLIGSRTMYFDQDSANQQEGEPTEGEEQQYVLLLVNQEENESAQKPVVTEGMIPGTSTDGEQHQHHQQIVLTPEQLQELGLAGDQTDNVLVVVDDGSGNITTPDGSQIVLDPSQLQGGQETVLLGDGAEDGEAIQVMINEQGEVQLVQPSSMEGSVTQEQKGMSSEGTSVDSVQQFLNSAHADSSSMNC